MCVYRHVYRHVIGIYAAVIFEMRLDMRVEIRTGMRTGMRGTQLRAGLGPHRPHDASSHRAAKRCRKLVIAPPGGPGRSLGGSVGKACGGCP